MWLTFFILALSLAAVVKGADLLIDGGASLGKRYHISPLIIGLTIIAFGTSMPEIVVNLFSAFKGISGISIGNIVGSNVSNILLVLGLSALFAPLAFRKSTINQEIPYSIFASVLLLALFIDLLLSRWDGLILIAFFSLFLAYLWYKKTPDVEKEIDIASYPAKKSLALVAFGTFLLFIGGKYTIDAVIAILNAFSVSEMLISSTVIAVGTSLPELTASLTAVYKKSGDMAVGNIVGSNIFNILLVLGLTSLVLPLPAMQEWMTDLYILIAVSALLLVMLIIGKKHSLSRWKGIVFLICYAGYLWFLIQRG